MKTRHLVTVLLLVVALVVATTAGAYAAPLLQEEGARVGLFGTVTAIVDSTIILDGGEIVTTDENTRFLVPGVENASLADIAPGDRVAVIALEFEDGSLLAVDVLLTPEKPVDNDHVIGVVTGTEDGLVTITDNEGNEITIELPEGATAAIGDLLTIVSSPGKGADKRSAKAIAAIDDVIDRLVADIQEATGEALERLRALLENNGDEQLTALIKALEQASEEARDALEAALNSSHSHLTKVYEDSGTKGSPHIRVKGFITALALDGGVGSVTIDSLDDGEVILTIIPATEIEDPIEVGDFVKAKYNPGLVAKKIEIEDGKLKFKGTIESFTSTELVLDGQTFVINLGTEIKDHMVVGAEASVKALPVGGSFVALEIKVQGVEAEYEAGEFEFKGIIAAITGDPITVIELVGLPVPVLVTPDTKIKGTLAPDSKVEIKGILKDDFLVALKIKVKEVKEEEGDEGSEIEFDGIITALISDTEIEVNGVLVLITPDTEIKGILFEGAEVEVEGYMSPNGLSATEIKVEEELEYEGTIVSYSSTELVLEDGTTFVIDERTEIDGTLSEGAEVEVEGYMSPDGLVATEIEVEESEDGDGDD